MVPLTVAYLAVLSATMMLISSNAVDGERLLLAFSTNLHELARVPARVLVGSAFWTSGWLELAIWFEDVGASYAFFAIAGFAAYLLRPSPRVWYLGLLAGYVVAGVMRSHTFHRFRPSHGVGHRPRVPAARH
jgi:hypothetical protein